ncbi:hypothetical protein LIER_16251 [Lithospermum erythrorhizon]|uniref:Succinate dehydrogenase subunit 3 n=1 Tax=Lithospermum erythrorhizon TaxID=34254 RepID=A0AAV3Q7U1_LITER
MGQLPMAPHAEGAYTFPSSASRFTGFQKRFFSHSTLSENETKMNVPETKRPSFGLKAYGNFSFSDVVSCHNKTLLAKSRPYHSVSAEKEGENSTVKTLRPLSPHLAIYQPLANSMSSILNRISAVTLVLACLGPYLWLNIASIGFTYSNFYLFSFYASNFVVISAELTALAFIYHLYQSILHLVADFSGKLPITKRMK